MILGLALCHVAACGGPSRKLPTPERLQADALAHREAEHLQNERLTRVMLDRITAEHAAAPAGEQPDYDILMLSGGGEFGAFGAGVLYGWRAVADHALARPEFDVVTGVSTGSLIAPFAFAGSDQEIQHAENLYKEVPEDLAVLRGILFFLPWRKSFFDTEGLDRTLHEEIGTEELSGMREGYAGHRMLLVGSTDLDLGVMHMWELGREATQIQDDEQALTRIRLLLRASTAIPAAFPPVEVDGHLNVDGGVAGTLFMDMEVIEAARRAIAADPAHPRPRLRLWVIVNGKISAGIQGTPWTWPAVAERSSKTTMHFGMATELRRLALFARWLDAIGPLDVEFRYVAIPESFEITGTPGHLFDHQLMIRLADLGEKTGRDPGSWRSSPPRPEELTPGIDLPPEAAPR
jgi:hypothetical protein